MHERATKKMPVLRRGGQKIKREAIESVDQLHVSAYSTFNGNPRETKGDVDSFVNARDPEKIARDFEPATVVKFTWPGSLNIGAKLPGRVTCSVMLNRHHTDQLYFTPSFMILSVADQNYALNYYYRKLLKNVYFENRSVKFTLHEVL